MKSPLEREQWVYVGSPHLALKKKLNVNQFLSSYAIPLKFIFDL